MKYEDKPVDKVNFLPPRKRHNYEQQQLLLNPTIASDEKKEIKLQEPVKLFKKVENSHSHQQIQNDYNTSKHYASYLKSYSQDESLEDEEDDENDEKLYCICKERYNSNLWMIACDICNEWFHGKCVDVTAVEARKIKQYACPNCTAIGHKTLYKAAKKKTKQEELQELKKRPLEDGNNSALPLSQRRKKVTKVVNCSVACVCQNTTITEGQMIQCDKCRSWLHCTCVSINPLSIPPNYTCPKCKVILDPNGKGNFLAEFKASSSILNLGNKLPLAPSSATNGVGTSNSTQQQQQILHLLPQVKDNLTNTLMNNSS
eukprot:gene852-9101_t